MTSWQQAIDQAGTLPDYIYINGERVTDNSLDSIETFDPGSGQRIGAVPAGNVQSINDAVDAAQKALHGPWADISPKDRGMLLWQIGERVRADKERLANRNAGHR